METMTLPEPVAQTWEEDAPAETPRTIDLVELMLKDRRRLDAFIRDEGHAPELIPRLLAVALVGFTIFGVAATVIVNLSRARPPGCRRRAGPMAPGPA